MLFSWLRSWLPTTLGPQPLPSNSIGEGSLPTQVWQEWSLTGLFNLGTSPINFTILAQKDLSLTHYTTWAIGMLHEFWSQVAHGNTFTDRALTTTLGMGIVILAAAYIMYGGYEFSGARSQTVKRGIRDCASMVKITVFTAFDIIVFPMVCGWLLDIATLPLFPEPASFWTRVEYAQHAHLSSAFLHWFAGTCFMFAFSIFITACRDHLRPGVLWFIRDPNDPQFHPIKDILEKPIRLQIRKLFLSMVMYACLALGGCGLIILCVSYLPPINENAILPLRWQITQPLSPLPVDLLLLHMLVPPTLKRLRLKRLSKWLLNRWWQMASRQLRLTSFMFGTRASVEEGIFVRLTWSAWLTRKQFPLPEWFTEGDNTEDVVLDSQHLENIVTQSLYNPSAGGEEPSGRIPDTTEQVPQHISDDQVPDVYFHRDGSALRVPNFDSVPVIPGRRMLVRVHPDGTPMDPTEDYPEQRLLGVDSNQEDGPNFTVVYAPPYIRLRLLVFVLYLWLSVSTVLALWCIIPLLVGRATFQSLFHALANARDQGPSGQLYEVLNRLTGSPNITALLFSWIAIDQNTSVHDFYSLLVGWYICGVAIWLTHYIFTRGHHVYLRYWARRIEAAEGHEGNVDRLRRRQLTQLCRSSMRWLRHKGLLMGKGCVLFLVMGMVLPTYIGLVGELYLGAPARMASVYSVEQWLRSHGELHGLQVLVAHRRNDLGSMLSDTSISTEDSGATKSPTTSSPFNVTIPPSLLGVTLNPAWVKVTFALEEPAHGSPDGWTLDTAKLDPTAKTGEYGERVTSGDIVGSESSDPHPSIFTTPYNPTLYLLQSWAAGLIVLMILFSVLQALPASGLIERWRRVMPHHHIHRANIWVLLLEVLLPATLATMALVILPPVFTLGLLRWTNRLDLFLNPHLLGLVYPIALISMSVIYGAYLAFSRWRSWITAIRHEEYLIGRQLHNIADGNE
ncbi:hypothetical protein IWQ61_010006 [Dispira simplex]|nr:hypothetical protein IWQ61_010006 [Dispira simplex]